jgi:hypothetical protein
MSKRAKKGGNRKPNRPTETDDSFIITTVLPTISIGN